MHNVRLGNSPRGAQTHPMDIAGWWLRLLPATQEWLIAHNGEVLPREIADEIRSAGGSPTVGVDGVQLGDSDIDWIETVANEETP